jgi:hypothetical protein
LDFWLFLRSFQFQPIRDKNYQWLTCFCFIKIKWGLFLEDLSRIFCRKIQIIWTCTKDFSFNLLLVKKNQNLVAISISYLRNYDLAWITGWNIQAQILVFFNLNIIFKELWFSIKSYLGSPAFLSAEYAN